MITSLCITYNTKELFERAYNSVNRFHPDMPMLIIDGSDKTNECYAYTESLKSECVTVVHTGYNIGHGRGMDMGLHLIKTPYALIFDSDIIMLKSPVEEMLGMMQRDTFGVGWICEVGLDGFDYGVHPQHKCQTPVRYLHPYFQLVRVVNYKKYHPYVHHGAPCYLTMIDIQRRGLSGKILKRFPGLTGFTLDMTKPIVWNSSEYILHDFGGTRISNKAQGKQEIEGSWERKEL